MTGRWTPAQRTAPAEGLAPSDFAALRTLLHERTGIRLEDGKEYFVAQRLTGLAMEEGHQEVARLLECLHLEEGFGPLHRRVLESLAVSETSFFRDLHPFEALRNEILPRLIAARGASRHLRIWSAACASGQEIYSLAMMIRDAFPELLHWELELLGTDFSQAILRRARAGRFSQIEVNRGLPAAMLPRYFTKEGNEWCLREEIRRMVTFREHNLVTGSPMAPPFDVMLLRNVLLYFDLPTRRQVLELADRSLRPDGALLVGAGETTTEGPFHLQELGRTVVLRPRPDRAPLGIRPIWIRKGEAA